MSIMLALLLHWKQAMNDHTTRDRKNYGDTDVCQVAYPKFAEKLSNLSGRFHGYDYSKFMTVRIWSVPEAISGAVNFIVAVNKEQEREEFPERGIAAQASIVAVFSGRKRAACGSGILESVHACYKIDESGEGRKISLPK